MTNVIPPLCHRSLLRYSFLNRNLWELASSYWNFKYRPKIEMHWTKILVNYFHFLSPVILGCSLYLYTIAKSNSTIL